MTCICQISCYGVTQQTVTGDALSNASGRESELGRPEMHAEKAMARPALRKFHHLDCHRVLLTNAWREWRTALIVVPPDISSFPVGD
jgi:hypothetical protein